MRSFDAALVALLSMFAPPADALPPEASGADEGWTFFDAGWDGGITYEYRPRIPGLAEPESAGGTETPAAGAAADRHFHLKGRNSGSLYLDGGLLRGSAVLTAELQPVGGRGFLEGGEQGRQVFLTHMLAPMRSPSEKKFHQLP